MMRNGFVRQHGSLLVDSMIGVIVMGLTVASFASLAAVSAQSVQFSSSHQLRQRLVHNVAVQATANPGALTSTGHQETVSINGTTVTVTVWKATVSGQDMVHAATDNPNTSEDCTSPAEMPAACIVAEVPVPDRMAVPEASEVTVSWVRAGFAGEGARADSDVATFTLPAAGQASYALHLDQATDDGVVTVSNDDHPDRSVVNGYSTDTDGYVHGTVTGEAGDSVTVTVSEKVQVSRGRVWEVVP